VGEAARGVVEVDLQGTIGPGRDGPDPAHGRGTEPPTEEPPPQECGGDRVYEALLFWFTHLAASSSS
jgi:hypothetical protein